ncbi:hypothetical protein ACGFIF_37140 [Kribbella sp. NPDC049174]|uniref:hypothetical protein n=1 Tax=Kribbella sp. NPDC049174 TaxID=3364112 RepID=UPI0037175D7F
MDEQGDQAGVAAAPAAIGAAVVRKLFDINTFYGAGASGVRWYVARLGLLAVGNGIGGVLWGIVSDEPAGDRWFGERLISNAYLWVCLIATGLYAVYDRRVQRQRAETD